MTTASPAPPLADHTGNSSYYLRKKRQKKASASSSARVKVSNIVLDGFGADGKENERQSNMQQHQGREASYGHLVDVVEEDSRESSSLKRSSSGKRNIKSAGCFRRQVYKTHKAEIHFPVPPQTSYGSPRKGGRLAGNRNVNVNARKSRSATTSLFHLDFNKGNCESSEAPFSNGVQSLTNTLTRHSQSQGHGHAAWAEDIPGASGGSGGGLQNNPSTIYGQPAYGTPTLALRERVGLLEKDKVDLLNKLFAYEQELAAAREVLEAKDEETNALRERIGDLEESAREAEEARQRREEEFEEMERQMEREKESSTSSSGCQEDKVCENCLIMKEEVDIGRKNFDMMTQEYQKVEAAYEDSEAQRSELERRCYFLLLDADSDGLIQLPELATHEILLPYAAEVLEVCFTNWNYQSGIRNLMSWDDFSLFFEYVENKNTKASQNYWFNVLDIDGDGYIGPHDMRWLYDKVDKSECHGCIEFEDLLCQLLDMVRPKDMHRGFTLSELRKSKLCTGIIGILTNHNHMLLRRSTSEWGSGDKRGPDLPL